MWAKRAYGLAVLAVSVVGISLPGAVGSLGAASQAATVPAPGPTVVSEIPSLRTQDSDTYQLSSGDLRAVVYPAAINFKDASGAWQPIDNGLVASARAGYAYENKANSLKVFLPSDLGQQPVRVEDGAHWVTFALEGAKGAPTVSKGVATYADALPGVSVAYAAVGDSVKESITLANAAAAAQPLVFDVTTNSGLTPKPTAAGGLNFVDAAGKAAYSFAPPSMQDASGNDSSAAAAVSYTATKTASGYAVAVVPQQAFLTAADTQYPVTIDPTLPPLHPTQDCYITSGSNATSNYCLSTSAKIRIGWDSTDTEKRRGLLQFDLSGVDSAQSTVLDAQLKMNLFATTTSNSATYNVFRVAPHGWTNDATWTKYDASTNWTTPGGDFNQTVMGSAPMGASTGPQYWYIRNLVQGWIDGQYPNNGLLIKQMGEATSNLLDFTSIEGPNSSLWPTLTVDYVHRAGDAQYWPYFRQNLNDRMNLAVNMASGNLLVHEQDLHINGTGGMDLSVDRYYNSSITPNGDYGGLTGWQMGIGGGVKLQSEPSGDVEFYEPSGTRDVFTPGCTYQTQSALCGPKGVPGVLVQNADGTSTLHWNDLSTWQFDSSGKLTSTTDKNHNTISYAYNGSGNLATITDTQGRTVSFTRTSGYVTQMTDNAGSRTYGYTYDASNRLTKYTDPLTNTTQYGYDSNNNLNKITDPRGNIILIGYDSEKRVSSITRVTNTTTNTGPTWNFAYPSLDTGTCSTDGNPIGMTTVTDPDSHTTTYCIDGQGQATNIVDARTIKHEGSFNPQGNITSYVTTEGTAGNDIQTQFGYSTDGQDVASITLPASILTPAGQSGAKESMCYAGDAADPCSGNHTTTGSGPAHFPTSIYSFNDDSTTSPSYTYTYETTTTKDDYGDILTAQNPSDGTTTYTWGNPTGSANPHMQVLEQVQDPGLHVTTLGYDSEGNLTSVTRPTINGLTGDGNVTISYDALSRIHTVTDGKGVTTTYTYDALDRVKTITFSDSTHSITYGYDENGNLTSRVDGIGTWGFSYDPLNRRTLETRPSPDANVSYTYYDSGPIHTITDGSGTTTYAYNAVNLPISIKDPQNAETTISYKPHSNQQDVVTYPNGVTVTTGWANAGQMTSLVAKNGSNPIISLSYDYTDPNNSHQDYTRLNSTTDNLALKTTSYGYNGVDRITSASTPGGDSYTYAYSNEANLTTMTLNSTTTHFQYNEDNELTCKSSLSSCAGTTTTYGYDADGNLTTSSAGFSASYNALKQMTTGSNTYADAGQALRIGSGTKHFTYTQLGMASENTSSTTTNYLRSSDGTLLGSATGTTSGSKDYYILDALGSVIGTTNSTGALTSYSYDPYGNVTSTNTPATWGFASGYRDSSGPTSGMDKFGARYYDPSAMRWTQLDPKTGTLEEPMSQNGYLYVNGDPTNAVDQCGTTPELLQIGSLLIAAHTCYEWGTFAFFASGGDVLVAAATCVATASLEVQIESYLGL